MQIEVGRSGPDQLSANYARSADWHESASGRTGRAAELTDAGIKRARRHCSRNPPQLAGLCYDGNIRRLNKPPAFVDTILRDGLVELRLIQQWAVERGNKWGSAEEARKIKLRDDRAVVGLRNEHLTWAESKMETLRPPIRGLPGGVSLNTAFEHTKHGGSFFRTDLTLSCLHNRGWLIRNEPS